MLPGSDVKVKGRAESQCVTELIQEAFFITDVKTYFNTLYEK